MAFIFVFSRKKAIKIVKSLSHDLKKVNKCRPVLYTPPNMIINMFRSFFWVGTNLKFDVGHGGEKYSLRNT